MAIDTARPTSPDVCAQRGPSSNVSGLSHLDRRRLIRVWVWVCWGEGEGGLERSKTSTIDSRWKQANLGEDIGAEGGTGA